MTPALGLLLTTSLLMAAPAKEEDPAARAQATLQQVSKLPLDHQRVWLRLIEQRCGITAPSRPPLAPFELFDPA